MAVTRVAFVFLCLLAWDVAQLTKAESASEIIRELKTLRQNSPIHVAVYNLNGYGSSRNSIATGLQRPNAIADQKKRLSGTDLRVWGRTLKGSCSAVTQKVVRKGSRRIPVQSCAPFSSRTRVMIHQTQGTKDTAGAYQIAEVRVCDGRSLFLRQPLRHTFYSGSFGGSSPRVTQVVPIVQATIIDVCHKGRIEAPHWNGKCGGIIALQAKENIRVCRGSVITASGAGFRGAPQFISKKDYDFGYVGESELVGYSAVRRKQGFGLGGGAGNGNSGGAGGAHKTIGSRPTKGGCTKGGPGKRPSRGFSSDGARRLYFGGSGGASGSHAAYGRKGAKGGQSGGIVLLQAKGWIKAASNSVQANGLPGQKGYLLPDIKQAMGGGGGGAGGTVAYKQGARKYPFRASVTGGAGGSRIAKGGGCQTSGSGGGGGVGEVILQA